MHELKVDEFHLVKSIFKSLPNSVVEGNRLGRIFVDDMKTPRVALVCYRRGLYYLAGDASNHQSNQSLYELLFRERPFYLYSFPEVWEEKLDIVLKDKATKHYRQSFDFNPEEFSSHRNWREKIPLGFRLERIDAELMERIANDIMPWSLTIFWNSISDFIKKGFGFCLLHDAQIASVCYSATVGKRECSIDIKTVEKFRRRGFAMLTASAFIEHCLGRGFLPTWECHTSNKESMATAKKLGFFEKAEFPIYIFHA